MSVRTGLDWRTILVGFAGAGVVLSILLWIVGIDGVVRQLRQAGLLAIAAMVGLVVLWQSAWGLCLHAVLRALGTPISRARAILVFVAATFANQVTPFGQAGGEPLSALLVSEAADTEYENGLAAIASVDTLHFFPSIGMALTGFGVFLLRGFDFGRNLFLAGFAVLALLAGFGLALSIGWRFGHRIEGIVLSVLVPLSRWLGRVVPWTSPPSRDAVRRRVEEFGASIGRIARHRRLLVLSGLFSFVGWFTLALCLWLALASVGSSPPFVAMLVVLPVASIAGVFPLPGGLGGVETAFILLLVSTTGVATTTATAAVVIYRGVTYWLPMLAGGGVVAVLVDNRYY